MKRRDSEEAPDPAPAASRSQQKRDAADVAALGRRLVDLAPERFAALELDEELCEAVTTARRLRKAALSRQRKLIAKLLRGRDCVAIEAKLSVGVLPVASKSPTPVETPVTLQWCERIVTGQDDGLQEFLDAHPGGDRQQLRQLARSARDDPKGRRGQRARRTLLAIIGELTREDEA